METSQEDTVCICTEVNVTFHDQYNLRNYKLDT